MATIYEVSELAGVSLATVSRVMNKNARVSEKTAAKVRAAMEQLGYRPNSMAQSLASNRTNSIGILVSELHGPFYGVMMSGIEKRLRGSNKHAIITAGHSNEEDEKKGIEFLISRNCDALILHVEAVSDEYLVELSKGNTPIVLINRHIDEIAEQCISLNNTYGGYLATKAMLEQGHRQFGYISGPQWKQDTKERLEGHYQALKEFGIDPTTQLYYEGDYQETGGTEGMNHFLDNGATLTAIVCGNDEMAAGAMGVLHDKGYNIPEDVSVIGFDNVTLAKFLHPKLTTIDYPIQAMGEMCADWALKNIYKKSDLQISNLFKPVLVERNSIAAKA